MRKKPGNHLEALLSPVTEGRFFTEFFERAALHIEYPKPTLWARPAVMTAVQTSARRAPELLRVVKAGSVLPVPPRLTREERYFWALGQYENGATLVLNRLEELDPASLDYAKALGAAMDSRVSLTAFLTPAGSQGFVPHFDTDDVFVVQVDGCKDWFLGGFEIRLPTARQGYLITAKVDRRPRQRLTLRAGQILYLPRGLVHWARASTESSLHISIDVSTIQTAELAKAAINLHARELEKNSTIASADLPCVDAVNRIFREASVDTLALAAAKAEKWKT